MLADSEFVLATYILNKIKFPSVLMNKVGNRDNTISVGVMLGTKDTINKDLLIELVEDEINIQIK